MEEIKIIAFFITTFSWINFESIIFKNNFLLNYTGQVHQKFTKNNAVPLLGGIIIIISLLFLKFSFNTNFFYFLILFFLIGILSDISYLKSAKLRLFLQLVFLFFFINYNDISISSIRFLPFDLLLDNQIFNIFFTVLCMLILINGTNFIDGCNTLVIGYFLIVGIILLNMNLLDDFFQLKQMLYYFFSLLFSVYILNFFQKLFLGDSGVYIISFLFGIILLDIYKYNSNISPYFICILLWYPAFEVFFSIIRKLNFKTSVIEPDTNHFHQLLYFYLSKKFLKYSNNLINSFTSNFINFYNLIIFLFASKYFYDSKILILLIILNIVVYCYIYLRLYRFRLKN